MSAKKSKTATKKPSAERQNKVFFMATVEAVWKVTDEESGEVSVKQRKINILLENDTIHLAKKDLDEINRGVFQRLHKESGVAPNQVADIILLNVCILGNMTPDEFYGTAEDKQTH